MITKFLKLTPLRSANPKTHLTYCEKILVSDEEYQGFPSHLVHIDFFHTPTHNEIWDKLNNDETVYVDVTYELST